MSSWIRLVVYIMLNKLEMRAIFWRHNVGRGSIYNRYITSNESRDEVRAAEITEWQKYRSCITERQKQKEPRPTLHQVIA
jgi:hypothetical protein